MWCLCPFFCRFDRALVFGLIACTMVTKLHRAAKFCCPLQKLSLSGFLWQ